MRRIAELQVGTWIALAAASGGCNGGGPYMQEERLQNGLVIILPGIEGESQFNRNIRRGLLSSGIDRAMPIHRWGRPVPGVGMLLNQMDVVGNRIAGAVVAERVMEYQDEYPGRPVHLIGHSGGGGIAVFAAEALKDDHKVDGLVLLSASISSAYDLSKALSRSRSGLVNFYSEADVGLLVIGTILAGNVDGTHGPAAGAIGFDRPRPGDRPEKKRAYSKLHEFPVSDAMLPGADAHTAATGTAFVRRHVAPWVMSTMWPAVSDAAPADARIAARSAP
ncbi:MAG: alpha/beta fold hydrolase [Planctomycetota bacterium]